MEASFKKSYASLGADRLVLLWLGVWWIANLVQAGFTELANDEAYYHMFAIRQPRSEGADSGAGRPQNHAPGKFFRPGDGPFGGNGLFLQSL